MAHDDEVRAIARMQAAMDRQTALIGRVAVENGPTWPENLAVLRELRTAHEEFEEARKALNDLGYEV